MHSLFLKIFLWFWLTVVLTGGALVATTLITRSDTENELEWKTRLSFYLPSVGGRAVEVYEREGSNGLKQYLEHSQSEVMFRPYFLDANGKELLGHELPSHPAQFARTATYEMALVGGSPGDRYAMQKVRGPSGQEYTVLVVVPRVPLLAVVRGLGPLALLRLLVVLFIGGVFCFLLARHITRPVIQVGEAASKISEGHLETRVEKEILKRRDEIGRLGLNFDGMAERIESLVSAQQRLLGVVSHELRSPLARLCVALGLLRQCSPEETTEYLDRIELESESLDKLIGQLLLLSRIDSGADSGHKERIDLDNLMHEIAADGNFEAQSRGCSVKVDSVSSCVMTGAAESIRRAVENVVRNAIHHTRAGSEVEIRLRRDGFCPSATAIIQIRDYGPGVPVEDLKKIFLPFHRVESRHAEGNSGGAGLGLAITDRIVRTYGGTVTAENASDGGLVVELQFPLNE